MSQNIGGRDLLVRTGSEAPNLISSFGDSGGLSSEGKVHVNVTFNHEIETEYRNKKLHLSDTIIIIQS